MNIPPKPTVQPTKPVQPPKPVVQPKSNFFELCRIGTAQEVDAAIKAGADVNAKGRDKWTILMFAARENANPEIIATLIRSGADVNAKNKDGLTALMLAATYTNPEIIATLIKSGADVNAKNQAGFTALDYARENKELQNTEAYRMLESMTRK